VLDGVLSSGEMFFCWSPGSRTRLTKSIISKDAAYVQIHIYLFIYKEKSTGHKFDLT